MCELSEDCVVIMDRKKLSVVYIQSVSGLKSFRNVMITFYFKEKLSVLYVHHVSGLKSLRNVMMSVTSACLGVK